MQGKRILLIIGGGISAYKCLELIRRLRDNGAILRTIMTKAGTKFITPLSVGALTNERVFTSLFDLNDEQEIGHIKLAREADLLVVAPATADLMARMATGLADDLATSVLLVTDKPILVAPAMNPQMWRHAATQRNVHRLIGDGVTFIGPNAGEMAEQNEAGLGRMAEPPEILAKMASILSGRSADVQHSLPLHGRRVVVTTGPTHEPIDPVRYIANRSSGKQGLAVAQAAAALGAETVVVSGPTNLADPPGLEIVHVETAQEMLKAVEEALPADVAICAAAVADWRLAKPFSGKIKKEKARAAPKLEFVHNPDILRTISERGPGRPPLVIGFAAETDDVVENAKKKLRTKGCDWIVANDVSTATGVMGGDCNTVHLVTSDGVEDWPQMAKEEVARRLVERLAALLRDKGRAS